MNWVVIRSRYMGIIKQKQSKNYRKTKSHVKTPERPRTTRAHGRVPHHGQPVVATSPPGPDASSFLCFDLFWTSV